MYSKIILSIYIVYGYKFSDDAATRTKTIKLDIEFHNSQICYFIIAIKFVQTGSTQSLVNVFGSFCYYLQIHIHTLNKGRL